MPFDVSEGRQTLTTGSIPADTLQFIGDEEGRVRLVSDTTGGVAVNSFKYDYFLKDHLGNTRMVLTEEQETDQYPMASMEVGDSATENLYYTMLDNTRTALPAGYPTDTTTKPNQYVAELYSNGNNPIIGPGVVLKVMAGDQFSVRATSWYQLNGTTPGTPLNPLTDVVTALIAGVAAAPGEGVTAAALQANPAPLSPNVMKFLADTGSIDQTKPHAFLNWVLFDNQFNYVAASSGFQQVGANGVLTPMTLMNLPITSSGYLYIYTSNATANVPVFFDNLQVTHTRGPLLEEDHYYPFGLTMAGISDKAIKTQYPQNKYRYTGKELQNLEFSDGSGLEWTDYGRRMYDQQIGRWYKTDGKAELYQNISPYVYAANQPTNAVDPDGNVVIFINGLTDESQQGNSSYWRYSEKIKTTYNNVTHRTSSPHYRTVEHAFDKEVMQELGDGKARYYDGSVGGTSSWTSEPDMISSGEPGSLSAAYRANAGYESGKEQAAEIIESLDRTGGVITESIKIITHSMGAAYGKGFVQALKEYIKTLPKEEQAQIRIALVADFDPYQAGEITADPDILTKQYKHANDWNISGLGFLANEDEKGLSKQNITTNSGTSTDHNIFSFMNDISSLAEGTYKWDGKNWIKQ